MHKSFFIVGLLTAFLPSLSIAATFDELLALNLDELATLPVVTASRTTQSWSEVQGSLWVVTEKEIRERGYRHIADLLRDLPSVDEQGPYSTSSRLTVRGVTGNTKMLILLDGVRLGAPAGELMPVSINYPLYMASQVEVLLTPGAALYGADAVSGVINIISKKPLPADKQVLTYEGSESRYQHSHILLSGNIGSRPVALGAHKAQFNNQDLAAQYPDIFTFNDLRDGSGKVVIPASQRRPFRSQAGSESVWAKLNLLPELEVGASYRIVDYPTDFTTLPDFTEYGGTWEDRMLTVYGRYLWQFDDRLSSNTLLSWSSYRLDKNSFFNNVFSNYQPGYKYAQSKKLSLDSQWTYVWNDNHTVIAGVVFDHLRAVPRSADLSQPYDPGVSVDQQKLFYPGTNNSLPVKIFKVAQDNTGLFVQDQYRWSKQLSSQLGLRFDDNSDYDASISPSLGVKYQFNSVSALSLTYSQAFLAPSPSYSYEHFGSFNGQQDSQGRYIADTFRIPNPDLQPETAEALELVFSHNASRQWRWLATAYVSQLHNLILFATNTDAPVSDFIPGGYIKKTDHNVNLGESVAHGLELSTRYRHVTTAYTCDLWANYGFTDGHLQSPKGREDLPYTAGHKLKLGSTWRWPGGLFISPALYVIGQSRVPSSASDGSRSVVVPSYELLNLYAGYEQVVPGVNAFLRVENVASSKYYNAGGSSKRSLIQLPQLDRTITLGVELEF